MEKDKLTEILGDLLENSLNYLSQRLSESDDCLDGLITSMLDLNERVRALEEIAADYVAEQEAAAYVKS
ncbi:hypothetical protein MPS38_003042 [Salmonella enterica]|nr:hypothetical protein [Salmonella enterica]EIZ5832146.1 hypothetical protein [Salmonella enterica]